MIPVGAYREALGKYCEEEGIKKASKAFGVSYQLALYWHGKYSNKEFHSDSHGGARYSKFSDEERFLLESKLWECVKSHPCWSISEFVDFITEEAQYDVNDQFIRRIFKGWRWSWKKSDAKQPQKYSLGNINYSIDYNLWVRTVPFQKLKFLDESHFNSKGMFFSFRPPSPLY